MMTAIDCNSYTSASAYMSCQPPVVEQASSSILKKWGKSICLLYSDKAITQLSQNNPFYILLVDNQPVVTELTDDQDTATRQDVTNTSPVVLADRLDLIKERLALSITQMAELFGVTRKSIYDWYEGKGQRSAKSNRMEILIDVLDTTQAEFDQRRLKAVWNIAVSGKSFRDVFCDDKIDTSSLRTALIDKLHELSPRMAATTSPARKAAAPYGEAHLAEFDRRADFG